MVITLFQTPYNNKFDFNRALKERGSDCTLYYINTYDNTYDTNNDGLEISCFMNHYDEKKIFFNKKCRYLKNPNNACSCEPCCGFIIRSARARGGFTLYELCFALYIIHKYTAFDNHEKILIKTITFINDDGSCIMNYS
jgi:hypothetical protein